MSNRISGAEIFSTGTHNNLSFSEADLDAIASAFETLGSASRVPLKFGHNDAQAMTDGQPALGWVERVWRDGGKLLADFTGMPAVVYSAIKQGLYKHVSVELLQGFSRNGASYPWVLDAVALLGADIPAVRGLKDLQALAMARALPGVRFTKAATFTQASKIHGDSSSMTPDEIAALQKRAADAEAALDIEKKRSFAEKVEAHRVAIKARLEAAVVAKQIQPAIRERVLNSRQFKSDEDVTAYWSDTEINAEIERNTSAHFSQSTGATSKVTTENKVDLTGKTIAEMVTFTAQAECVRLGQNPLNADHMTAATKRLFSQNPKLARAYFDAPHDAYKPDAA